jgi:hypothetical protein
MPLYQRTIKFLPKIPSNVQPTTIDDTAAEGGDDCCISSVNINLISSCVAQLADLSSLAHDIFTGLLASIEQTSAHLSVVNAKAGNICKAIDDLEDKHNSIQSVVELSTSVSGRNSMRRPVSVNVNKSYLQNVQVPDLVDRRSLPQSLKDRYCSPFVHRIPDLQDLDRYKHYFVNSARLMTMTQGYSNPEFFLQQWVSSQEKRMNFYENEKQQQKADKKQRHKLVGKSVPKAKPKSTLNWQDRYACIVKYLLTSWCHTFYSFSPHIRENSFFPLQSCTGTW